MDIQQKDYVLKQGLVREELVWGPRRKGGEGRKGRVGGGGGRKGIWASTREGDWEGRRGQMKVGCRRGGMRGRGK